MNREEWINLMKGKIGGPDELRELHADAKECKALMSAGMAIASGAMELMDVIERHHSVQLTYNMAMEAAIDCMKQAIAIAKRHELPKEMVDKLQADLALTEILASADLTKKPGQPNPKGDKG